MHSAVLIDIEYELTHEKAYRQISVLCYNLKGRDAVAGLNNRPNRLCAFSLRKMNFQS